jgi:tripartite-type tricarboxylate transporter receptor subunit TctC
MRSFVNIQIACSVLTVLAYLLSTTFGATATDYPNRTITLVVPRPPGGGVDAMARVMAAKLSDALNQQVIIDNRGSAGGTVGTREVAQAKPDGYTLLLGHTGTIAINPTLYAYAGYDPLKDFVAVGLIAAMPLALIVNPSFTAKSVAEVVSLAKQQRGKLNLGTTSTSGYLCAEMFKAATGADVVIIRYNGTASLVNDLIGGHVQVAFSPLSPALGNIRAGNLRVLGVTSAKRLSLLPDVPTFDESGLPGFEAVLHYGLLAPAGTPEEIVDKLSVELRKLVDTNDVKQRIQAEGGDPMTSTPAEYAADIEKEVTKWSTLIRKLNLKVK